MLETILIVLLVLLDQGVKYLVRTQIPLGGSVDFLPGILGFTHVQNAGAAFSILPGARWFFIVLTGAFIGVAVYCLRAKKFRALGHWSLVLVLAGAIGNLIDRIIFGYVVDMIEVQLFTFAVFNVADILVVVGGIAFCVYFAFFHDRKPEKNDDPDL